MTDIIITQNYESPCGTLVLGNINGRLCLCDWRGDNDRSNVENRVKRLLHADLKEALCCKFHTDSLPHTQKLLAA